MEFAEKGTFEIAERGVKLFSTRPMPEHERAELASAFMQMLLVQRKYSEALQQAESVTDELLANMPGSLLSKYEVIAIAKKMLKDQAGAREAFQTAKGYAEKYLSEAPKEAERHARLAQVLAGLGEKTLPPRALAGLGEQNAAVAEAKRATELLPESVDAFDGPNMTETLAAVYATVGEQEKAIDLLDGLLSRPGDLTVAALKVLPVWDPLRANPRFIELLKKYGGSA